MSNQNPEIQENLSDQPKDHGLAFLREQTKNVMIPLLIKVFQIRLEAQQVNAPPSRLTTPQSKSSLTELTEQLSLLNEDLKRQEIWIQSSRSQIKKVLAEIQEPTQSLINHVEKITSDPSMQKSFQEALEKNNKYEKPSTLAWFKEILRIK